MHKNNEKKTPLHWAVTKTEIIHAINKSGIAPYKKDSTQIIDCLIQEGADVNIKDSKGYTPLHQAILDGSVNKVRYLINHGANVDTATNNELTPIQLAESQIRKLDSKSTKSVFNEEEKEEYQQIIDYLKEKSSTASSNDTKPVIENKSSAEITKSKKNLKKAGYRTKPQRKNKR